MTEQNAWDLGGGGDSFPFDTIGDEIEGLVINLVERQSTDMETGEPAYWDNEKKQPKMLNVVTLETGLRETAEDTGHRTVALSGSKKPNPDGTKSRMAAVLAAVRQATGGNQLQYKGRLKVKFVGEGVPTRRGFSAPKYFEAWYQPPAFTLQSGQPQGQPSQQQNKPVDPWATPAVNGPGPDWANDPYANQQPPSQGANWPNTAVNQQQPNAGVNQQQPNTAVNQQQPNAGVNQQQPNTAVNQQSAFTQAAGNPNFTAPVPAAVVESLKAMGQDPATIYGPDYLTRVVG